MNENELRPIFSEYGQLYELLVLRDKASGNHKGLPLMVASHRVMLLMYLKLISQLKV